MKQFLALMPPLALLTACYGAPPPAPPITPNPPGGVYSASGTTPPWSLTVDSRQMVFTDRSTNLQVIQPTPSGVVGAGGENYVTPRIRLNIVHATCTHSNISAIVYPDRVTAYVDGRRFNGCGGN